MAPVSMIKALVLAVVMLTVTSSAQDIGMAPSPSPDAGAAFSLPVSTAFIVSSLFFSLFALLRH
ncbi:hypothetical protein M9H77_29617 [Catharanthus roseus]|uniref:Uncharacterized protein n=1 Tax=Catharanthus roseus TaxID=4058 RepID=A0ACB9ZWS8_CATRO|nr:hypothetical protein M9H77_29617 [Catharanthus roseus]